MLISFNIELFFQIYATHFSMSKDDNIIFLDSEKYKKLIIYRQIRVYSLNCVKQ